MAQSTYTTPTFVSGPGTEWNRDYRKQWMLFAETKIDGAFLIEPERRVDERGFFARIFCEKELAERGLAAKICQVNTGFSPRAGTLRGLHFQTAPHDEVKLARCLRGSVFDVAVDLRPDSPTYKRWTGHTLSAQNAKLLYVPAGCAHGYLTLAPDTELMYFTSMPYVPSAARGLRYNDPAFAIAWPAQVEVISAADRTWPFFADADSAAAGHPQEDCIMIIVDTALASAWPSGNPVRVAMVGAGYMARGIALQILTAMPGIRLVAISNRNAEQGASAPTARPASIEPVRVASAARARAGDRRRPLRGHRRSGAAVRGGPGRGGHRDHGRRRIRRARRVRGNPQRQARDPDERRGRRFGRSDPQGPCRPRRRRLHLHRRR